MRLNRELRLSEHSGNRVFIVPFALVRSNTELSTLRSGLKYGPNGFRYQFLNYMTIACGAESAEDSWEREWSLIENFAGTRWENRRKALSRLAEGLGPSVAMQAGCGLEISELTADFAMWDGISYCPEHTNAAAVYLTIAAALQEQREKDPELSEDSLRTQIYRPVVLDPNNFVRFNDPLIQSCIWRASLDGELDYRRSPEFSAAMSQILLRMLHDSENGSQSAFVDLLIGIAVGKVRLTPDCHVELGEAISKSTKTKEYIGELYDSIFHE